MKVIIVTGLSGAGKTRAIDVLEDIGYYCVDNMPPVLVKNFIELSRRGKGIKKAAFVIDARGGEMLEDLNDCLEEMSKEGVDYRILFLEATDRALARRYNETRRDHPLSPGESVTKGIKREKKKLEFLRQKADVVIDTTSLNNAQLAREIEKIVNEGKGSRRLVVNIMSFGYKNGMPITADMVFDARFIPNPYYVKSLKNLTGNNRKVQNYVMKHEIAQQFMENVVNTIEKLIPYYKKEGKYSLSVCFGCTGGQHRSVTLANVLNQQLSAKGLRTTIEHRDL
ncbi:MAG: RNase adapter RapZ [Eubacteriales bacterium]|nr:RNase adapter RapZ [Eubacteriales bacterium]